MSHQDTYKRNEAYADFLAGWDEGFYAKYTDTLKPQRPGARVLDVGCGVGQVVGRLAQGGFEAHGVDVSEPNIDRARKVCPNCQIYDGTRLPFPGGEFDRVVVVDMLEHVADEAAFVAELARVTRPGGRLIVNTPHLKETALRRFRHALGQTDERHGHLRPGYTPSRLAALLGDGFTVESERTYSRFFSELVDTGINWGVALLGKPGSAKGQVVTGTDLGKHRAMFLAYSAIYPFVWAFARLDALIPWASGYMLIVSATRRED